MNKSRARVKIIPREKGDRVSPFSRGVIFTRAPVSLALLWGLLVVYPIRCVTQNRPIKRDIEHPVAIHDVKDVRVRNYEGSDRIAKTGQNASKRQRNTKYSKSKFILVLCYTIS